MPKGSNRNVMSANPEALRGKSIAFFGNFNYWPSYHGASPEAVAKRHGAILTTAVRPELDYVVFGDKRGTGRADAKKKVASLQRLEKKRSFLDTEPLQVLDESMYRELVRIDVQQKRFALMQKGI